MNGLKGIVLLTRFDYVEHNFGRDKLKAFMEKLTPDDDSPFVQPIGISKDYPEDTLRLLDELLLTDIFNGDKMRFLELGRWNARHLAPKYFEIYQDEKNPAGFLWQMARTRAIMIGLGEMQISELGPGLFQVRINYGQPYLKSVKLSEQGFLEEGCRLCQARNISVREVRHDDVSIAYEICWEV
jgi:hypothetical protein